MDLLSRLQAALRDRYDVERELGRGGMATVYLAQDRKHDRRVAVKVLHPELAASLGAERFLREIRIAAQLSHPHILPLHDSGEADGLLYYVMPFVEGESLRDRLERERQLAVEDALRIGCQVATALDYAHRRGIVHRDIKPENILLLDGLAVVADFGIARAISKAASGRLTESGMAVGTAAYMSPEQGLGESETDGRSDIYSLACVLYELLVGHPPFTGTTVQSIIARHAVDPVPSIRTVRGAVPEDAEAAIMCALAKSPADRFPSAGRFAEVLTDTSSIVRSGTLRRASGQRWRPAVRRSTVLGLAAVAVLGLVWGIRWLPERVESEAFGQLDTGLDPDRIAVLYFQDLSRDSSLGHLADGLTESLINRLADVRGLEVVTANGVEPFRDAELPRDSIARALNAGTLLLGTVEPEGDDRIRVNVELIEGGSAAAFERESFTSRGTDPFAASNELAAEVEKLLREALGREVRLAEQQRATSSAQAWALVQRAERLRKEAIARSGHGDEHEATAAFDRADTLLAAASATDPRWAEPLIARASLAYHRARLDPEPSRAAPVLERGLVHAEQAVSLAPRNAAAREMRGSLHYLSYLLGLAHGEEEAAALVQSAEADLRRATELDGSRASAWSTLSHLLLRESNVAEAHLAAQRAYEADAYLANASVILWRLFTTSYEFEDFVAAADWCAKGSRRFPGDPRFHRCHLLLLTTRQAPPDVDSAWRLLEEERHRTPPARWEYEGRVARMSVAAVIARAGYADSARAVARRARGNPEIDPERELLAQEAYVHVLLDDHDAALRLLTQYTSTNPEHRAAMARHHTWRWRPLESDARFQLLMKSGA